MGIAREMILAEAERHLSPDEAMNKLGVTFSCKVCLMVVEEPKECQDCN